MQCSFQTELIDVAGLVKTAFSAEDFTSGICVHERHQHYITQTIKGLIFIENFINKNKEGQI